MSISEVLYFLLRRRKHPPRIHKHKQPFLWGMEANPVGKLLHTLRHDVKTHPEVRSEKTCTNKGYKEKIEHE